MMNTNVQAGGTPDLLSSILGVEVKNEENGRLDVKFKDAAAAERCWKKLRLDTLKTTENNE